MAYGVNRAMAMCSSCGHARMNHLSGSCSICGCSGGQGRRTTGAAGPSSPVSRGTVRPQRPTVAAAPARFAPKPPLIHSVATHLALFEEKKLLRLIAAHHGLTVPSLKRREARRAAVLGALDDETASRYLQELRRRHSANLPYLSA